MIVNGLDCMMNREISMRQLGTMKCNESGMESVY